MAGIASPVHGQNNRHLLGGPFFLVGWTQLAYFEKAISKLAKIQVDFNTRIVYIEWYVLNRHPS